MESGSQSWDGCRLKSQQTHDLRAREFLSQRNPTGICDPHREIAIAKLTVAEATAAIVQPAVVPPICNGAQIWHAFGFVLVLSAFLSQGGASSLRVGQPRWPEDRCLRCNRPIPPNVICRSSRNVRVWQRAPSRCANRWLRFPARDRAILTEPPIRIHVAHFTFGFVFHVFLRPTDHSVLGRNS
jgi:hypothetical protein